MMQIKAPFTRESLKKLRVGSLVSLSGNIVTGRDRVHKAFFDGAKPPVSLENAVLFHCGPIVLKDASGVWKMKAAGPTTSIRYEMYESFLIEKLGVRIIIGKGGMGEQTRLALAKIGGAYLQLVGGAAVSAAHSVKRVAAVHFLKEFGSAEAMWELEVENLEAVVTMDPEGNSLYKRVEQSSRVRLRQKIGNGGRSRSRKACKKGADL